MKKITYIWQDRKRTFLGLPLSFTKYMLTEDRLFVEKGFLNSVLDEENLYRVRDVRVSRTLGQRLFGLGTVTVPRPKSFCPRLRVTRTSRTR